MKIFVYNIAIIFFWILVIFTFLFSIKIYKGLIKDRSINVYSWTQMIAPKYIKKFEKETGIKVNISYYETNEELLVKLKATGGMDYDLIIPSDYMVLKLREMDLIKPLNKEKLYFFDSIEEYLLGHYFDPTNKYSVPFYWSVYGIGIDKDNFKNRDLEPNWNLLFDDSIDSIGMLDDPREVICIAAKYLFGKLSILTEEQIKEIEKLLIKQKKRVVAYTDFKIEELLITKNSQLVLVPSSEIFKIMKFYKNIDFLIPNEGTFMLIDSFVIPKLSMKEELVYKFINYLYQEEALVESFNKYGLLPPIKNVLNKIDRTDFINKISKLTTPENFIKQEFFKQITTHAQLNSLWVNLKSD